MSKQTGETPAASWDTYWQGTSQGESFISSSSIAELAAYWSHLFARFADYSEPVTMLDIASGHGAVLEAALNTLANEQLTITCVDNSASALKTITQRFEGIRPCHADAAKIPFDDQQFTLVTSQFGAEYAGQQGLHEAARMVQPGGVLAMILHHKSSGIYTECRASADAVRRMLSVDFIGLADAFLRAAFVNAKGGNPANYAAAKKTLLPALTEMKAIMSEHGQHVAGDTVHKLYTDVSEIHGRIQNYDANEIRSWLRRMNAEMPPYIERMKSMCAAALDEQQFSDLTSWLRQQGFTLELQEQLALKDAPVPLAWALTATRG